GVYLVGLAQRRGEQMVGSQLAGLVVPYLQEFRELGVDEQLLRKLADGTGGGVLNEPGGAFLTARRKSKLTTELWPWLVGCVAFLLVPEIAVRRMGWGILGRLTRRRRDR
ncbi:MAG: hypothetical protein ACE5FK_10705, partial [Candidatus Methylomirabilia bacterium]